MSFSILLTTCRHVVSKDISMTKRILDFIIVTLERKNIFLSTLYRLRNFGYVYRLLFYIIIIYLLILNIVPTLFITTLPIIIPLHIPLHNSSCDEMPWVSFLINDTQGISSQNECIIGPGSETESRLMFL